MQSQELMNYVSEYGPIVIAAAAAAAAVFPQGDPNSWWGKTRRFIDFLALNFGNAKNAPKKPDAQP